MSAFDAKTHGEEAVRLYLSGKTLVEISAMTGWPYMSLNSHLKKTGHFVNRGRSKLKEKTQQIIDDYLAGETMTAIGEKHEATTAAISALLKRSGINHVVGNTFNHEAFDVLTPDALYWIGFMITDGCVIENRHGVPGLLRVTLASEDRNHLAKLYTFVGSSSTPYDYTSFQASGLVIGKRSASVFRVSSTHMAESLAKHGIVPRKTYTVSAGEAVRNSADFWRGAIDGDGWINWYSGQSPCIGLCSASSVFMSQFADFVASVVPGFRIHIGAQKSRGSTTDLFKTQLTGWKALRIITVLYGHGGVSLDRKQAVADKIMTTYSPKQHHFRRPIGQ